MTIRTAKDARALVIYGMTREAYEALASRHGSAPYAAYSSQRAGARKRGIDWRFTFAQWWSVWESSGKWAHRGRRLGQYVMSRPGDRGPYSPENVAIVTNTENVLEHYNIKFPGGNYSQARRGLWRAPTGRPVHVVAAASWPFAPDDGEYECAT